MRGQEGSLPALLFKMPGNWSTPADSCPSPPVVAAYPSGDPEKGGGALKGAGDLRRPASEAGEGLSSYYSQD